MNLAKLEIHSRVYAAWEGVMDFKTELRFRINVPFDLEF
jgi:hypothetical protein